MKLLRFLLMSCCATCAWALAAQAQVPPSSDPMDLSGPEARIGGAELPSVKSVAQLKALAEASFNSGDCDRALPLIREHVDQANRLANLIRSGLEPIYGAPRDERPSVTNEFINMESRFNGQIFDRNKGWVMEAECLAKMGDNAGAAVRLVHALDYISPRESSVWKRARDLLWKLVGASDPMAP